MAQRYRQALECAECALSWTIIINMLTSYTWFPITSSLLTLVYYIDVAVLLQEEDENGEVGVSLSKDLMSVAGDALKTNITTLGPLALPFSEQLLFFLSLVGRKVFKMNNKPYIPDFKLAFEHFCIHAGGRAVLDELEKNLDLSEWHMEPSRMTLYKYVY